MGRAVKCFPPGEALEGAMVDAVGEVPLGDAEGEVPGCLLLGRCFLRWPPSGGLSSLGELLVDGWHLGLLCVISLGRSQV